MQYISGLFMDEWASPVNRSSANFAYAQILHAKENHYPVWGWSASDSPKDGYLGWGHLKDTVVTPHACILALQHYPHQVLKNLRTLEAMGARSDDNTGATVHRYGFRDAIDIQTKEMTQNYLYLDQGMIFLTLVNYLKGNALRKAVEREPEIRRAKYKISDYAPQDTFEFETILRRRDENPGDFSIPPIEVFKTDKK